MVLFILITTLACVLILNHISKMLSRHLTKGNAKPSLQPSHQPIASSKTSNETTSRNPFLNASNEQQQQQRTTIFSLPAEIRLQIYSLCLPSSHPYILGRDYGHSTSHFHYPNLLHTNRQLRAETLPMFFSGNTFIVDIHALGDLKSFLKWLRLLSSMNVTNAQGGEAPRAEVGEVLGSVRDLRLTVGGCLLVEVVPVAGRRKYGDQRVVATRPRLDNSLKWDRKNILHHVCDFEGVAPRIEEVLRGVGIGGEEGNRSGNGSGNGDGDCGLRVSQLLGLVELLFRVEKMDSGTRKIYERLIDRVEGRA